jgi:hypothetical protein
MSIRGGMKVSDTIAPYRMFEIRDTVRLESGKAKRAAARLVSGVEPIARLFFLIGKGTHVGLSAAVERGPSQGARSGSTGLTWVPLRVLTSL